MKTGPQLRVFHWLQLIGSCLSQPPPDFRLGNLVCWPQWPGSAKTRQLVCLVNSSTATIPMQKKILIDLALMLVGCFVVRLGGYWLDIGIGLFLLGCVMALFRVRDIIHRTLQRRGLDVSRDRVLVHLCAVVMAAFGAAMTLDDTDPRMAGIRWPLIIGLALSVYAFDALWRLLFGRR